MEYEVTEELKVFVTILFEGICKEKVILIYGEDEQEAWIAVRILSFMHALKESMIFVN